MKPPMSQFLRLMATAGTARPRACRCLPMTRRFSKCSATLCFFNFGPQRIRLCNCRRASSCHQGDRPWHAGGNDQRVSPEPSQVLQPVHHLQPRIANARTLLILDNVWQRQAERQRVTELSALVPGRADSRALVSTRSRDLAVCADESRRFKVGRVPDKKASRRIIEFHACLRSA